MSMSKTTNRDQEIWDQITYLARKVEEIEAYLSSQYEEALEDEDLWVWKIFSIKFNQTRSTRVSMAFLIPFLAPLAGQLVESVVHSIGHEIGKPIGSRLVNEVQENAKASNFSESSKIQTRRGRTVFKRKRFRRRAKRYYSRRRRQSYY